jgi:UDP:flavonoid glycosyltransferase YjiC (YdhE family)
VRVLFTTHGAFGHFHPVAPIALELEAAGHNVAFATEPPFVPVIARAGFEAFPMGLDLDVSRAERVFPELKQLQGMDQALWSIQNVFFGALPKAALPDAVNIVHDWRPDIVLHELSEVAGLLAAEKAGLRYVSFHWTGTGVDVLRLMVGDAWNVLREEAGLEPDPEMSALGRWLTIAAMPACWAESPSDHRTLRVRLPLFDRAPHDVVPDWIEDLGDHPVIYATLGTVFNDAPGVMDALIAALGELEVPAVVTVGRGIDPTHFEPHAATVRVEEYVPQSLLLPKVDAVVHHAGFNTLLGALNFGLPQVLIPVAGDQPILAARANELGIAIVIGPDGQRSPASIANAVDRVLNEVSFRERARRLQADLEALPGVGAVEEALGALA